MYPSHDDVLARFELSSRAEAEIARKVVEDFRNVVAKEMDFMQNHITIDLDTEVTNDYHLILKAANLVADELKALGFRTSVDTHWHDREFSTYLRIELKKTAKIEAPQQLL